MNQLQEKTIGEYVAENFRTAAVFKKDGINFCCKGGRTIEETCKMKDLDPAPIYEDLKNTPQGTAEENDFNSWSLTDWLITSKKFTTNIFRRNLSTCFSFWINSAEFTVRDIQNYSKSMNYSPFLLKISSYTREMPRKNSSHISEKKSRTLRLRSVEIYRLT